MDNKKQADDIASLQRLVKELCERVHKLENPERHGNKDINDKLSDYAQNAAQGSRGPLKPDELIKHFTDDGFGKNKKEALAIIRQFPNNYDGIINQFSHIRGNLENRITYRKKENEKDDKLIKRIRKFNKTVEDEQEKEKKSDAKPKIQSTMDQFLNTEPQNVSTSNNKTSSKAEVVGKSKAGKQRIRRKEADKENRKRKTRNDDEDDESCSSQEVEVDQITVKFNKRLKFNSSQESVESNSLEESDVFSQRRDPRPMVSIQSNSEGSSQSDFMSEDDSPEIFTKTKTDLKSAGKHSKELKLRSKENAQEYNGNEETVHEKHFPLRGKQIR